MRPRQLVRGDPSHPLQVPPGTDAVVVGAGVAGVSAAVVLAERGVRVTLLEAAATLGGRLGAWPHTLPDGEEQVVEHGFHAFFRQYYTWRAVLRRIDPELRFLAPVRGYPVIARDLPDEDLSDLPAAPPLNLLTLAGRSASLRPADLASIDPAYGQALLAHDRDVTRARFDDMAASTFLDRLGIPPRARRMLFEAFARSFFCNPAELSAAELIEMFHFYFLGNPEGIAFDAPTTDHRTAIWDPLAAHLRRHRTDIRTATSARTVEPDGARWRVDTDDGPLTAAHLVLALDPGGLRGLVAASPGLAGAAPVFAAQAAALRVAPPFVITRLWLDRDVAAHRATFSSVSGEPTLDEIAVYSRLEEPSADWARRTGGSVLELHAYASDAPDAATATARMRAELAGLWPETADARVLHRHERREADASAFPPGSAGLRPGVTPGPPGMHVAGDFVELDDPAGLMERASMSGVLAANAVLADVGARAEPVHGVPQRGLLAGTPGLGPWASQPAAWLRLRAGRT
jgi:isorenieratene synthase